MYTHYFRLTQAPFSIAPDPRYLFMSERHREALAHLLYGINGGGGIVLLTGDIGTGKTTVCRSFLGQVPANCHIAYIFNPKLTVGELLQTICEEFHIALPPRERSAGAKECIDALNRHLLASHAEGRNNVLVIDEAQNLSADVLEQLRLLTNLETNERKLLQIILIGQPELRAMLMRPELEQLAQRVIAHYHLTALSEQEIASYIQHRLATAGLTAASPFQPALMTQIHRLTGGVPRRINLLCDRALLGAYARGAREVDRAVLAQAAGELFIARRTAPRERGRQRRHAALALLAVALAAGAAWTAVDGTLLRAVERKWGGTSAAATAGLQHMLALGGIRPHPAAYTPAGAAAAAPTGAEVAGSPSAGSPPSAPATVPPRTDPLPPDAVLRAGAQTEKEALRLLARMWDTTLPEGEPCAAAIASALRCHKSAGGFAELGRLDRPAVLTLYDEAGKPYLALLTGLNDRHAALQSDDIPQRMPLAVLARHFRGEFVTLWRTPPGFGGPVQIGDRGPAVDWIAAQMARLNDAAAPAAGQAFGVQTQMQVRRLQQAHGLFVDGVVGAATAMQINRAAGVDEPSLRAGMNSVE